LLLFVFALFLVSFPVLPLTNPAAVRKPLTTAARPGPPPLTFATFALFVFALFPVSFPVLPRTNPAAVRNLLTPLAIDLAMQPP
jgi:hypothetical protein